jgi:hypothetical protein
MKKYVTILFAFLILLSGMHLIIATHFCGGEITATKVSISGKEASCGMAFDEKSKASSEPILIANCCENKRAVYSVDNNYIPAPFHVRELSQSVLHELIIPEGFTFYSDYPSSPNLADLSPPGNYAANAVRLADICVFRV